MNTFLEQLRQKPEHVRQQIAFFSALGMTSLVTLGWGVALFSSHTLALDTAQEAPSTISVASKETPSSVTSLLGAASAAFSSSSSTAPVSLSVVGEQSSSTFERSTVAENRTVIPF